VAPEKSRPPNQDVPIIKVGLLRQNDELQNKKELRGSEKKKQRENKKKIPDERRPSRTTNAQ